jgi:hypothetical protein
LKSCPGEIKANISKRDDVFADDYVAFCLNTFSDGQNAYVLFINPLGIQGDGLMNSIGNLEPFYWGEHIYDKFYGTFETINVFVLRFRLPRNSMFRVDGLLGNEVYVGRKFSLDGYRFRLETQRGFFFKVSYLWRW